MPLEGRLTDAGPGIPELERLVAAGRDEASPIGREGAVAEYTGVARECRLAAARRHVPEVEGAVPVCRDEASPIGREGAGVDDADDSLESRQAGAHLYVPEVDGDAACRDDMPPVGREGARVDLFAGCDHRPDQRLGLSLSRAQVEPGRAARRAAPGRPRRHPLGSLTLGDMPLQAVVKLLEDEGREAGEVGREEVVQLARVVARKGLE